MPRGNLSPARIETRAGVLCGEQLASGICVFRGVPYAAPPLGDRRWRGPAPYPAWAGVRSAQHFGPIALQPARSRSSLFPSAVERRHEDCLFLNIWTPSGARGDCGLPVIVWLHMGGFQFGSGSSPLYDGEAWAKAGVVFVSLNFRLGWPGFLVHPQLRRGGAEPTCGNYGLLDQIAALRWVRDNVDAFGGNPECVTLMGVSSGATSISLLMACPAAAGLFHRAIAESGGSFGPVALNPGVGDCWQTTRTAEAMGVAWAEDLGARDLSSLLALGAADLSTVLASGQGRFIGARPTIDGQLLPQSTFQAFANRRQAAIPLLVGAAAQEGLASLAVAENLQVFRSSTRADLGEDQAAFHALYPATSDAQARRASLRSNGDRLFAWQAWAWARLHAHSGAPTFFYRFAQPPPAPGADTAAPGAPDGRGAFHGASIFYGFDRFNLRPDWRWTDEDRALGETLRTAWVEFARCGRPSAPALPAWPAFEPWRPKVMMLKPEASLTTPGDRDMLTFWDHHFARRRASVA